MLPMFVHQRLGQLSSCDQHATCGRHSQSMYGPAALCNQLLSQVAVLQVAKKFIDSLQRGQYHLSTPDLGQDLLIMDATASWSPRNLPLLVSCLLAPIVPVAMYVCTKWSDRIVRRQRKSEQRM